MKDNVIKLRALVSMKTQLLNVLMEDLAAERAKCDELTAANEVLSREVVMLRRENDPWWRAQDEELARREAEEAEFDVDIPFDSDALTQKNQREHWDSIHVSKEYEDDR